MSKEVFITGASAGFGFDTVKALAERGHTVYATMRGVDGKNAERRPVGADVAKPVTALNTAHAQVQAALMAVMSGGQ